jgi:hypothetical protein
MTLSKALSVLIDVEEEDIPCYAEELDSVGLQDWLMIHGRQLLVMKCDSFFGYVKMSKVLLIGNEIEIGEPCFRPAVIKCSKKGEWEIVAEPEEGYMVVMCFGFLIDVRYRME